MRSGAWTRRLLTVPAAIVGAGLLWPLLPLLAPAAALHDVVRGGRASALRTLVFVVWVATCEVAGLAAALVVWLLDLLPGGRDGARFVGWNYALQHRWNAAILGGMARIFGVRYEVEGGEALARGGFLLLPRHGSGIDYALPIVLAGVPYRRRVRYVLKASMRWDPCLDIVGHRIPNAFVEPGRGDRTAQERKVAALADGLGADDAITIYPEGQRYTPRRRARMIEELAARGRPDELERARRLRRTLLPRTGAVHAILDAAPRLDLVLLAHHGLERANGLGDFIRGELRGVTVRVRLWRIAAPAIPREDREAWFHERWAELDAWLVACGGDDDDEVSAARRR